MCVALFVAAGLGVLWTAAAWAQAAGDFYSQRIRYEVEDASAGYIVWGINGWQRTPASERGAQTSISHNLLLTPLHLSDGVLAADISVPIGATIDCYFWITKSGDGVMTDVWDPDAYHVQASGAGPITIRGNLDPNKKSPPPDVLSLGWLLLGLCLASLAGVGSLVGQRARVDNWLGYSEHVLVTAASLFGFMFLARMSVIPIGLRGLMSVGPSLGASDLLYVLTAVAAFLAAGLGLRGVRSRRVLAGFFSVWATLSLAAALVNIGVVAKLGHPFNYRWLYYSDFLGSTEAHTAILENVSLWQLLNLVALCVAMLVLARTLKTAAVGLAKYSYVRAACAVVVLLLVVAVLVGGRQSWTDKISAGRLVNPVTAFVTSLWDSGPQGTLFSIELPDDEVLSYGPQPKLDAVAGGVRNIVLIVLESAGARYFDMYGGDHAITPNLVRFAPHSMLFETAYAHSPSSNKSLVSLVCSLYPLVSYHSLTQDRPDYDTPSLSSVLSAAGYRTSFFTSSNFAFQGMARFLSHRQFGTYEAFEDIECEQRFRLKGGGEGFDAGIDDACLAPRLLDWIAEQPQAPFFAMLWTNQGHYPYFLSGEQREFDVDNLYQNRYLNALANDDAMIGTVVDALIERGLFESTLVAVVGDHGEAFGQHGQSGHGNGIYEENLRVPLILINPTLFKGERSQGVAGLVDLAPTLLHLTGHPVPSPWQGRSLLAGERENETFFFAPWSNFLFGFRLGDRKVIFDESSNRAELYDLAADPDELHNLAEQSPGEVSELRRRLAAWVQRHEKWWRESSR